MFSLGCATIRIPSDSSSNIWSSLHRIDGTTTTPYKWYSMQIKRRKIMRSPHEEAGQPKEMRCAHMKWISKRTWMEYHTHHIGPMNQKESTCMHHWNPLRWCLLQHCYYARPSRLIRCREISCVTHRVRAVPGKARSGFQGIWTACDRDHLVMIFQKNAKRTLR